MVSLQNKKDHRASSTSLPQSIDDKSLFEENANLSNAYLAQPNYIDVNPFYNNLVNEDSATSDSESTTINAGLGRRAFDRKESSMTKQRHRMPWHRPIYMLSRT